MVVTHKRSLLKTKRPLIRSYEEAHPGVVSDGVITGVRQNGCIVTFYQVRKALLAVRKLRLKTAVHGAECARICQYVATEHGVHRERERTFPCWSGSEAVRCMVCCTLATLAVSCCSRAVV